MRLGQASCPYCGAPLSTEITSYNRHIENCSDNPDNWEEDTRWIELVSG